MEVVILFDSDKEGHKKKGSKINGWPVIKTQKSSTALIVSLVGHNDKEDFVLEDLFPEYYYLKKFQESHKKKMILQVSTISY